MYNQDRWYNGRNGESSRSSLVRKMTTAETTAATPFTRTPPMRQYMAAVADIAPNQGQVSNRMYRNIVEKVRRP